MNNREQIDYNKLIGVIGDEYIFLDYVFKHNHGFKGATGTSLVAISQDEYEERTDPENIKERYEDAWRETVRLGKTTAGLNEWVSIIIYNDGVEECAFDTSYWNSDMWTEIREKTGHTVEEYPVYECTRGGRMFKKDMQWDELYEPELWKLICEYEDWEM